MSRLRTTPFDHEDVGFNALSGWTWIGCYGGYYLQADVLEGFEHGFFTRLWQGRPPEVLAGYLSAGTTVHRPRQVHGNVVLKASQASLEPWPDADGLCSDSGGQSLWVCGADCTPVLLADPVRGSVAACHAGWRGVASGILSAAVRAMQAGGSRPTDLRAAMGPAVSGACYQVEQHVCDRVATGLAAIVGPASPGPKAQALALEQLIETGAISHDPLPGRHRLDIRLAARLQLEGLGIPAQQISVCPLCTVSQPDLFHSWRRDQVKAVQWSGIVSVA